MAKHKRKNTKGKPVTAHPLFPAVVALWFGSLFGLGSLAIRPSLLENVVVSAGIDLVVPAAGPPLGVTARILLALTLAAVGATIGAVIGRWIARPKPVVRQRRRGAGAVDSEDAGEPVRYNDNPVFAAAEAADADAGSWAGRRRALAIEHGEDEFVPHDSAPLPGGGPQVFDIAGLQLGGLESAHDPDEIAEPLDLGSFADAPPPGPGTVQLDWDAAAPAVAKADFHAPEKAHHDDLRQVFTAPEAAAQTDSFQAPLADEPDNRQIFGQPNAFGTDEADAVAATARRQIFGAPVQDDHVSQDFVKAAGFKTTVFEVEEHAPLFPSRLPANALPAAHEEEVQNVTANPFAPAAAVQHTADLPDAPSAPAPLATELQTAACADAANADTSTDFGALGMTDLAQRLAQSMERRRAARAAVAASPLEASPLAPEPAPALPNAAEGIGALSGAEVLASVPAPFAASAPTPPVVGEDSLSVAEAIRAAEPDTLADDGQTAPIDRVSQNDAQAFELHPARFETKAPDFSTAFSAPISSDAHVAATPLAMPAALRPLSFDDTTNDDLGIESLLPPRRISMPTMPSASGFHASAIDQDAADEIAAEALEPEEDPASAGAAFGSLIDLGANLRTPFVRIEEPEAPNGAVEPVVIFPGQAPAAPFAPPQAASVPAEATQFRRFDAPASAGQGQPVEVSGLESALDPAEAERSLRSALANLQRMSGAA